MVTIFEKASIHIMTRLCWIHGVSSKYFRQYLSNCTPSNAVHYSIRCLSNDWKRHEQNCGIEKVVEVQVQKVNNCWFGKVLWAAFHDRFHCHVSQNGRICHSKPAGMSLSRKNGPNTPVIDEYLEKQPGNKLGTKKYWQLHTQSLHSLATDELSMSNFHICYLRVTVECLWQSHSIDTSENWGEITG